MMMPGRNYNAPGIADYRYGFNGKENDDEAKGEGNQLDYGFRIYDPRVGKFLSVDPLTKKYPELTPYQFASNTPIQAIDLDGLEAYFIHGTASDQYRWINKNNQPLENTKQLLRVAGNHRYNAQFNWGGKPLFGSNILKVGNGVFNNKSDRYEAAIKLVNHIMAGATGDEPITLIGHSHGGNVAIQAIPLLREALDAKGGKFKDVKINLITISTPADNHKESSENPETWGSMINSHIQIYNELDAIQRTGANIFGNIDGYESFDRTYKFSKTINVKLNVDNEYKKTTTVGVGSGAHKTTSVDGMGAHSFDNEHPEILKTNIDNGNIPRIK
jgi:RHS repeat-associated protein